MRVEIEFTIANGRATFFVSSQGQSVYHSIKCRYQIEWEDFWFLVDQAIKQCAVRAFVTA